MINSVHLSCKASQQFKVNKSQVHNRLIYEHTES